MVPRETLWAFWPPLMGGGGYGRGGGREIRPRMGTRKTGREAGGVGQARGPQDPVQG